MPRKSKKKSTLPPPPSPHPYQKQLMAVVISIIIVGLLLIVVNDKIIGRAFYTGLPDTAGFAEGTREIAVGGTEAYTIRAHIGNAQTTVYEFRVTFDSSVVRCNSQAFPWATLPAIPGAIDLVNSYTCDNSTGEIIAQRAVFFADGSTLNNVITLGDVVFRGIAVGDPQIRFDHIRVYDAQSGNNISLQLQQPTELSVVLACSSANLTLCRTENACENRAGGYWEPATAQCLGRQTCDAANVDACRTQQECTNATLFWYDNRCNVAAQGCTATNLGACNDQQCGALNRYWYDSRCNFLPEPVDFSAIVRADTENPIDVFVYMYLLGEKENENNVILASSIREYTLTPGVNQTVSVSTRQPNSTRKKEVLVLDKPISSNAELVGNLSVSYIHNRTGLYAIPGNYTQGKNVTIFNAGR